MCILMAQEKSTVIIMQSAGWEMASVLSMCHGCRPTAVDTTEPDGFD